MPISKPFLLTTTLIMLQGCTPFLIGGGAATTAGVIHDRRTAGTIVDDNALELKLSSKIHGIPYINNNSHINVTSYNGKVLLTGEAFNPVIIKQAEAITRSMNGVKNIINQVVIGRSSTLAERVYDTKQTAKVKAALFDISLPGFDPTRVKVVTEHGITYLMGLVTQQESNAITNIISHVSGVQKLVTLFEIAR